MSVHSEWPATDDALESTMFWRRLATHSHLGIDYSEENPRSKKGGCRQIVATAPRTYWVVVVAY